jgi:hypothetical protein
VPEGRLEGSKSHLQEHKARAEKTKERAELALSHCDPSSRRLFDLFFESQGNMDDTNIVRRRPTDRIKLPALTFALCVSDRRRSLYCQSVTRNGMHTAQETNQLDVSATRLVATTPAALFLIEWGIPRNDSTGYGWCRSKSVVAIACGDQCGVLGRCASINLYSVSSCDCAADVARVVVTVTASTANQGIFEASTASQGIFEASPTGV